MQYYVQGIRVEFVYEGHGVKVKVAGAKKVEDSYSRKVLSSSHLRVIVLQVIMCVLDSGSDSTLHALCGSYGVHVHINRTHSILH